MEGVTDRFRLFSQISRSVFQLTCESNDQLGSLNGSNKPYNFITYDKQDVF